LFKGILDYSALDFTLKFGYAVIVASLRNAVINGNIKSIRCFLAANPFALTSEKHPTDDKMTLIMLAARHGELLFTLYKTTSGLSGRRPAGKSDHRPTPQKGQLRNQKETCHMSV